MYFRESIMQQQQNNRDSFFLKDWSENYYGYSYGFNGMEKDDEVKGIVIPRILDSLM